MCTSDSFDRSPMFSLAVTVPYNSEAQMYDINLVHDTGEQVREKILQCDVYTGERVVAATVLRWPNVLDQCPNERVQWTQVLRKCPSEVKTWADVQNLCRKAVFDGKADHAEYPPCSLIQTLKREQICCFSMFLLLPVIKDAQSKTVISAFSTK